MLWQILPGNTAAEQHLWMLDLLFAHYRPKRDECGQRNTSSRSAWNRSGPCVWGYDPDNEKEMSRPVNEAASQFERIPADDLAWLGTDPVPAKPYYDPAYFELERKAVFLKSWIHVGHVCELSDAGSFIRHDLEFARASLLIVRGRDQQVRAFHNVCPHRGT